MTAVLHAPLHGARPSVFLFSVCVCVCVCFCFNLSALLAKNKKKNVQATACRHRCALPRWRGSDPQRWSGHPCTVFCFRSVWVSRGFFCACDRFWICICDLHHACDAHVCHSLTPTAAESGARCVCVCVCVYVCVVTLRGFFIFIDWPWRRAAPQRRFAFDFLSARIVFAALGAAAAVEKSVPVQRRPLESSPPSLPFCT